METQPLAAQELSDTSGFDIAGTTVEVATLKKVHVKACGRTFALDVRSTSSLLDVQAEVQRTLQMEGQDFQFFDGMGKPLSTDRSLREAIDSGSTPLSASLSDASIHYIENRREELAQMQWKLVREKMHGCMAEVKQGSRQLEEFQSRMQADTAETKQAMELLKEEVTQMLDHERDSHQASLRQVSEKVTKLALLITGEQNKREYVTQSMEKQMQELRDLIDNERSARQVDMASNLKSMQDGKLALEGQKRIQEAFEIKHNSDIESVRVEITNAGKSWNELLEDRIETAKKGLDDVGYKVRLHETLMQSKLQETEAVAFSATKRTAEVEAWCATMEERWREANQLMSKRMDELLEKNERVQHTLESVRHEDKIQSRQVERTVDRLKDLETNMGKSEEVLRGQMKKDFDKASDDLQRVQVLMKSEQTKQLAELEQKVVERMAMESAMRENSSKLLYEELDRRVEKPKGENRSFSTCSIRTLASVGASEPAQLLPGAQERQLRSVQQSSRHSISSASSSFPSPNSIMRPGSPVKGGSISVPSGFNANTIPAGTSTTGSNVSTKAGMTPVGSVLVQVEPIAQPGLAHSQSAQQLCQGSQSRPHAASSGSSIAVSAGGAGTPQVPGTSVAGSSLHGPPGSARIATATPTPRTSSFSYRQVAMKTAAHAPPPRRGSNSAAWAQGQYGSTPDVSPVPSRSHSVGDLHMTGQLRSRSETS
eukprot:TRINITY_DN17439_c0_g1_i1.p1 TRINITY_DN17439_c0_g1~~TRINITY_DN17439_c0_g1_i1.p1  ORF type:complete len:713 (+),score=155.12 TRINITY_DN17439_c0_g1_i1:48-2186(+)